MTPAMIPAPYRYGGDLFYLILGLISVITIGIFVFFLGRDSQRASTALTERRHKHG